MDADDADLLRRLAALATAADPVPPEVRALGLAAFDLRRLDAELAELVADSGAERELAGVRSATDTRVLLFRAGELVVELEVTGRHEDRVLLGQVALEPAAEGAVVLETARLASTRATTDAVGTFRFDAVRSGLVRLSVEVPGTRPVSTTWFRV